ncbi:MAG: hypothetical protein Alpg2KO_04290 [Alphaproteobacteria bacterium]
MTSNRSMHDMTQSAGRLFGRRAFWLGLLAACIAALVLTFWLGSADLKAERQDLKREAVAIATLATNLRDPDAAGSALQRGIQRAGMVETRHGVMIRDRNAQARILMSLDPMANRGRWIAFERAVRRGETTFGKIIADQARQGQGSHVADLDCDEAGRCMTAIAAASTASGRVIVAAISRPRLSVLAAYHWIGGLFALGAVVALAMLYQLGGRLGPGGLPATKDQQHRTASRRRAIAGDRLWLELETGDFWLPREWRRDLGHSTEDYIDAREMWERLLHPADRGSAKTAMFRVASGVTNRMDVVLRFARAGGASGYADTLCSLRPERSLGDGRVVAITGSMIDVSGLAARLREAKVALEAAAEANDAKSRFLATMSHEIRTPLNSILGFTETLSARYFGPLNPRQAEYLDDIHSASKHLLDLINDILDFSRIEAGELELSPEPVMLEVLISDVRRLHRILAEKAGVSLAASTAGSVPRVMIDRRAMLQVLTNLVSNAIKFTERGGSVTMSAMEVPQGVMLQVADTGIGIPAELLPEITQPFRMVDAGRRPNVEGTGLGLSIVARLVELQGGTMSIDSLEGQGTTVSILLPSEKIIRDNGGGRLPGPLGRNWPRSAE